MNKKILIILGIIAVIIVAIGIWAFLKSPSQTGPVEKELTEITAPKIYSEVFDSPIDMATEPERHKAVYEKVSNMVGFEINYPEQLPSNAKLTEVKSTSKGEPDPTSGFIDVGGFTSTYRTNEGKLFKLTEGTGDLGGLGEGEKVNFANGEIGYFWSYSTQEGTTFLLWFGGNADTPFRLTSQQLTKEELIKIANSILTGKE